MLPARKNRFLNRLVYQTLIYRPIRQRFACVWLRQAGPPPSPDGSAVILFGNHSSWWDGYMAMLLNECVWHLDAYAMVEENQLARYGFFRWVGGFSVNRHNPRSAIASIAYSAELLNAQAGRMLVIFPQGEILANDRRPLRFQTGIGHIVRRTRNVRLYPLAMRYEFVGEQHPEAFLSVGSSLSFEDEAVSAKHITAELEQALTIELDRLREDVAAYRFDSFTPVVRGAQSINRLWDAIRHKPQLHRVGMDGKDSHEHT
ncbi:MAG: lysophospholipid acyltransferase family protein [Anaerolineae bacterium]|nr:lysophospholipid acyltransferase family protein [Thermoflexales bacterium]MDW8407797.1 lysophospholipid acyltransferase family protein [Anaerolineae bacterium]